jgi:hypothetical protein
MRASAVVVVDIRSHHTPEMGFIEAEAVGEPCCAD